MLDLLPVPAVVVALEGGKFHFRALNRPFRIAGLGTTAAESPLVRLLGTQLRRFLESDETHREIAWQFGEEVDCRYFRVTFARRAAQLASGRCLVTLVDQTSELRTEHSLRREMATDSLTGLPNRTGFGDQLEAMIGEDDAERFAVLVVNLDRFSRVNAVMGGLTGDELLISVARRLKGALRGRDILARMGGDEFGVLLTLDDGPDDALQVAKRIQAALASPFRLSDFEIRVECSIGIALGADNRGEPENLIRHAQFAVKRAKTSGRTELYHIRAFDIAREQFGIETQLRRAIENGEMTLSYQPICDLGTGKLVSFEALARWTTERGVALSPNDFIPVAEESGLIVPLGRWAMGEAARTLASWDQAAGGDCGVKVAVNLSAIQLQRDRIPEMVQAALEQHGISGSRLTLELTESAIVSDPDRISRTMLALKDLGTTLAMDDFGTGYSNLAYLQKLPIDQLKIDRSFVSGMLADRDKIAIVRAVLSLAQALGMETTAEGIETNELAQTLAALGCTYGQGYLYARPLEPDAAWSLMLARNA
ncbi:bifunctional diguanylate cyclase/phosphodiesterase [Sphingomonas sp. HF-S4]|uniref:Bifunctional diguanylate cyclase/phosphodiesterase n=1 Tax=Sphingomonas agrestis TaxID=3080540 RepID=A0ABU3Y698_9SPHN|nr:bifunctional diguanylate cyclase/phosphodiesterase [Sphingomonas sp. HF-S4]MDV3456920.1 bifunctional diguanylate cyclase/phosphodiesterase [Sphingomonas sp. HF-S4]